MCHDRLGVSVISAHSDVSTLVVAVDLDRTWCRKEAVSQCARSVISFPQMECVGMINAINLIFWC